MPERPKIVALVGPTGAGKTSLGLCLAQRFGAEIVNADSRQVFRRLDIGSAKPTVAQRSLVPHHVFDVVDPDGDFDCAQYRDHALVAIRDIESRGSRALVVGGTGLYLKVLCGGLFDGPGRDDALRRRLAAEEEGTPGSLHRRLIDVDQAAASRLHPNDRLRVIRALEVFELTGRPISAWQDEHRFAAGELDILVLGVTPGRDDLYRQIDERCRAMAAGGLVEEVRALLADGYRPDLPAMQSLGYREIGAFLAGTATLDDAVAAMAQATRQFAKRQLTWFRRDPTTVWSEPDLAALEPAIRAWWA